MYPTLQFSDQSENWHKKSPACVSAGLTWLGYNGIINPFDSPRCILLYSLATNLKTGTKKATSQVANRFQEELHDHETGIVHGRA